MKQLGWRAIACAAAIGLSSMAPVSAGVATFDDVAPNLFGNGESLTSGGFKFQVAGDFGGVDTSAAFFYAAPTGNSTQFYTGLNDSAVTMSSAGLQTILLGGFDFAFVSPFSLGGPTLSPGALMATGISAGGATATQHWDFGDSDANGDFAFKTITAGALGALSAHFQSVTFSACLYDGTGGCVNPAFNQAQFSIDNIHAALPEPASLALVIGALGLLGAMRRKQST